MATWSLSGDDAGDFSSSGGGLSFRMSPDFEAPVDMDGDNIYMVTVTANAGSITTDQSVTVTVTNVDELGMVSRRCHRRLRGERHGPGGDLHRRTVRLRATWTLSGDDAGDFTISNGGELTFVPRLRGCGGRRYGQRVPGNGASQRRRRDGYGGRNRNRHQRGRAWDGKPEHGASRSRHRDNGHPHRPRRLHGRRCNLAVGQLR